MATKLKYLLCTAAVSVLSSTAYAQNTGSVNEPMDEVITTGIRVSLERAEDIMRNSDSIVDVVAAEDLGKFPDQNLTTYADEFTQVDASVSYDINDNFTIFAEGVNLLEDDLFRYSETPRLLDLYLSDGALSLRCAGDVLTSFS